MPVLVDSDWSMFFTASEENCIYNKLFSFIFKVLQKKPVFRDTDVSRS